MSFAHNEQGAVTVDWVVLTAALVGLGFAVMGVVSQGVQDTSGDIKSELSKDGIIQTSLYADELAFLDSFTMDGCTQGKEGLGQWFTAMHETGQWDGSNAYHSPEDWVPENFDTLYEYEATVNYPSEYNTNLVNSADAFNEEDWDSYDYDSWWMTQAMHECIRVERGL